MAWLAVVLGTLYYTLIYPVLKLTDWIFLGLAPILHLLHYALHALFVPLSFIARFETLYIYLGVAALVGVLTGSILHLTASFLISVLGLRAAAPSKPAAITRPRKALRRPRRALKSRRSPLNPSPEPAPLRTLSQPRLKSEGDAYTSSRNLDTTSYGESSLKGEYADWLRLQERKTAKRRRSGGQRRDGQRGVLPETILEEDDTGGDDGFDRI